MTRDTNGLAGLAPLRRAAGYTQETFAAALGVKRSALAMWEACGIWPSSRWLPRIAELLGCSLEELYGETETEGGETHAGHLPEPLL